jgi:hypothetical protein
MLFERPNVRKSFRQARARERKDMRSSIKPLPAKNYLTALSDGSNCRGVALSFVPDAFLVLRKSVARKNL